MDTRTEAPANCMTPVQRETIEAHFRAVHDIMLALNMVQMRSGWTPFKGTTQDGREVTHKFSVGGYVRHYPPGYGEE